MSAKQTRETYEALAKQRNHILKEVSNAETPSQGNLVLSCETCGNGFTTTAKSYKNARKTGCPHCKAIKARAQTYVKPVASTAVTAPPLVNPVPATEPLSVKPSSDVSQHEKSLARAQATTSSLIEKRGEYQRKNNIYDRDQHVSYLKRNPNRYNDFIVGCIEKEAALLAEQGVEKQVHHIFPRHAGGSDAKWNKVHLTPADHVKAHELRYEVYGEYGDYNFLQTKGPEVISRIEKNPAFEEHQAQLLAQRQTANQNMRPKFTGDDGSKGSKAILEGLTEEARIAHRERHQSQMSEPVRDVLQNGATFYHAETKTTFVLQPRQAPTLTELKNLLAAALPQGNQDRVRLETAKKPIDVTSAIGKMIKGVKNRPSAYGWKKV